jgi:hypothetical protein
LLNSIAIGPHISGSNPYYNFRHTLSLEYLTCLYYNKNIKNQRLILYYLMRNQNAEFGAPWLNECLNGNLTGQAEGGGQKTEDEKMRRQEDQRTEGGGAERALPFLLFTFHLLPSIVVLWPSNRFQADARAGPYAGTVKAPLQPVWARFRIETGEPGA